MIFNTISILIYFMYKLLNVIYVIYISWILEIHLYIYIIIYIIRDPQLALNMELCQTHSIPVPGLVLGTTELCPKYSKEDPGSQL